MTELSSADRGRGPASGGQRNRRLATLGAAAIVAICAIVFAGRALLPSTHHVTVVRVVFPPAAAADTPRPTLTTASGAAARTLAPSPQQAAAAAGSAAAAGGSAAAAAGSASGLPGAAQAPVAAPVGSAAPGGSVLRAGASASFRRLVATLPGRIELAISPLGAGATTVLGGDAAAHGWSTTKVPVLVSLLRARGAGGLTAAEQTWAHAAITESDNQSVLDLFGDLEQLEGGLIGASGYVDSVLRLSGDDQTVVATAPPPAGAVTTFGQTEWAPSEAVKFFRALARGCLLPSREGSYVLGLMRNIIPSESWGLGSGGFTVPVAFKGGWGPEPSGSYLVRQAGIIDVGSSRGVAVAVVAFPSGGGSGSFGTGTQMLTEVAGWLRRELLLTPHPATGCPTTQP